MVFANPIWLWGLFGLLVPVAIHLLSRKEGKVIKIGSVRHVMESASAQFSSIRLNELVLLMVRCLLVLFVVFLLAGLQVVSSASTTTRWLLIEKGLESSKNLGSLIDSLREQDFELRYLAGGFPEIEEGDVNVNDHTSYWSLVEALKQQPIQEVIVLSTNSMERFKGKRIALPENIRWISVEPEAHMFELASVAVRDSVWIRRGESDGLQTRFNWIMSKNGEAVTPADTFNVALIRDRDFEDDRLIIQAALEVLEQRTPYIFQVKVGLPEDQQLLVDADWVFWFSQTDPPSGDYSIITRSQERVGGHIPLTIEWVEPSHWQFTTRLTEGNAIEHNLTLQLAGLMLADSAFTAKLKNHDKRALPDLLAWSGSTQVNSNAAAFVKDDWSFYWMLLIVLTVAGERLLALKKLQ
jgi:hypothetical protein